uniref:Ig-like domain-containing protein n=1 Tax=Ciona savignyi TaxID=51511 RepID=H2YAI4_CIOSA
TFTAYYCHGVTVTLLNGQPSPVVTQVTYQNPIILPCSFQAQTGSTNDFRFEWIYNPIIGGGSNSGQNIVLDNKVLTDYTTRFSLVSPANLQINSAAKTDTGSYTCLVTLPHDSPSKGSGTYHLTVQVPPSTPQCTYTSDHALTIGFSAEFRCNSIEGVPAPTYSWYKNGRKLPLNGQDDINYKNTSYSYSETTGILKFSKVTVADAGAYYCAAANVLETKTCEPATMITTKNQDVGMIVGIVFGVIFGLLLIGVLVWWTWRKGYCDGFSKTDDADEIDDDGSNDVMLDTNGPIVNKPPSEAGSTRKQNPSMII